MPTVISLINLKGGVGKTTTAIALADTLTYAYNYNVLVIDIDPQTNATICLMDQEKWEKRDAQGQTLKQLFSDALLGTSDFDIRQAIVKDATNISGGTKKPDLLPSSLGVIEIQDRLPLVGVTTQYTVKPTEILKDAVAGILPEYDFVIIDCPPNLGTITLNGIMISDYYLIPTIPDVLSTYGIPQITTRLRRFATLEGLALKPLGIVFTKYREGLLLHEQTIGKEKAKSLKDPDYPKVFNTKIPLTVRAEEAADYNVTPTTLKQKYGYQGLADAYDQLVKEIHASV